MLKEYEIFVEIFNACAGERPTTHFEEVQLSDPDEYIKKKHETEDQEVQKQILENGDIQYTLTFESVMYRYTFTA
ncbi:MAG: hypothetical protein RR614_00820 [Eubacterium sp.]